MVADILGLYLPTSTVTDFRAERMRLCIELLVPVPMVVCILYVPGPGVLQRRELPVRFRMLYAGAFFSLFSPLQSYVPISGLFSECLSLTRIPMLYDGHLLSV